MCEHGNVHWKEFNCLKIKGVQIDDEYFWRQQPVLGGYPKYPNIRFRYHPWYPLDVILDDIWGDIQLVGYHMWCLVLWYPRFILDIRILIFGLDIRSKLGLGYWVSN